MKSIDLTHLEPTEMGDLMDLAIDVTAPNHVEVIIVENHTSGRTLWVNVHGVCVLRCCRIGQPIEIKQTKERR